MNYVSTQTSSSARLYSSKEAVLKGLAPDGGLFIPADIPRLKDALLEDFAGADLRTLLSAMLHPFLVDCLSEEDLGQILDATLAFPTPVVKLNEQVSVVELFHGPTCAFKDYGARFMAQLFSRLITDGDKLTVLVATSGDTGGAVAAGFHKVPGVRVVILYPSGKVSPLQELQLCTWGDNISALEVTGSFDDCQALVKQAFRNEALFNKHSLTSANSINIARLLPQMIYYAIATQVFNQAAPHKKLYFAVPSGNLGNISAGILAHCVGVPIAGFHCAVNANDTMARYFQGAAFNPQKSVATISNAMDVGNPSNFPRLQYFSQHAGALHLGGSSHSDEQTLASMQAVYRDYGYLCDPHTAVGLLGAEQMQQTFPDAQIAVLATAHPSKFSEVLETASLPAAEMPAQLAALTEKEKQATTIENSFEALVTYLDETANEVR